MKMTTINTILTNLQQDVSDLAGYVATLGGGSGNGALTAAIQTFQTDSTALQTAITGGDLPTIQNAFNVLSNDFAALVAVLNGSTVPPVTAAHLTFRPVVPVSPAAVRSR